MVSASLLDAFLYVLIAVNLVGAILSFFLYLVGLGIRKAKLKEDYEKKFDENMVKAIVSLGDDWHNDGTAELYFALPIEELREETRRLMEWVKENSSNNNIGVKEFLKECFYLHLATHVLSERLYHDFKAEQEQ